MFGKAKKQEPVLPQEFLDYLKKETDMSVEDERTWTVWATRKKDEYRYLLDLLKSDVRVRDCFKKRALFLIFALGEELKSRSNGFIFYDFFWKDCESAVRPCHSDSYTECLEGLNENCLAFAEKMICGYFDYLKAKQDTDHLCNYNYYLRALMRYVNSEKAEALLERYLFNDVQPYSSMEDASGYNPFIELMLDRGISGDIKKKADDKMRQIVLSEVNGESRPRAPWENAYGRYKDIVMFSVFGGNPHYGIDLFADQLNFLLDYDYAYDHPIIASYEVLSVLNLLSGDEYKDLRYKITEHVMSERGKFFVYDLGSLTAAEAMLNECGQSRYANNELLAQIEAVIENGKKRLDEERLNKAKEESATNDLFGKMR